MEESGQTLKTPGKKYRKLTMILSGLGLTATVTVVGTWFVRSLDYVTTDDAQIKADVVTISSETSGRVVVLAKYEGDLVQPGEPMTKLDSREYEFQIRQAQADLSQAQSRYLQAKMEIELHVERHKEEIAKAVAAQRRFRHDLDIAEAQAYTTNEDWEGARELFRRELISKQELTHAKTEYRMAKARVASLEEKVKEGIATLRLVRVQSKEIAIKEAALQARHAEVQHVKERLADLKRKLELMTIRSPVQGRVAKREVQQGEFVQPGQPLFMVVDTTDYWVEANVEETKIRFIRPGSKAIVRVDSYPGHEFSGRVREVGEATVSAFSLFSPAKLTGVFVKSTQRLPVRIAVENTDGRLKVGMLAVVWIEKDSP